jgi:DMSO/TMAO reductase YedYZ heme-binding membrane subunit
MYNDFIFYFKEGWHHIISQGALDHQLFIAALTVMFMPAEWRRVVVLVTAFTIGHALTLMLSVMDVVRFSDRWVEFLIPCTIAATALINLIKTEWTARRMRLSYLLAFGFGLIHGMGYANAIRFSLSREQSLGWGLLSFNIGLEIGQIFVVLLVLFAGLFVTRIPGVRRIHWVWALSLPVLLFSLGMALERCPI